MVKKAAAALAKKAEKLTVCWRLNKAVLMEIKRVEVDSGRFSSLPAFINWLMFQYISGKTIRRGK